MGQMKKPLLLVVEDDGLIRLDLVDILQDHGFEVVDAANADQALAVLERLTSIDAILTDIDMPGSINGLGLARIVHEKWPHCKIVVISGRYHPAEDRLPPGSKFLTKPLSDRVIEDVLSEMGIAPP